MSAAILVPAPAFPLLAIRLPLAHQAQALINGGVMRTQNQVCPTIPLVMKQPMRLTQNCVVKASLASPTGMTLIPCLLTVAFLITTLLLKSVFGCQSKSQLLADFKKMRSTYNTRYVRVYGNCPNERANFLDDIIEAAYETGMGVFALVWLGYVFGFRG
jgi:hypothetical protein